MKKALFTLVYLAAMIKFTVANDMILNAHVDEAAADGKVALYKEGFGGEGGPMATNNYLGLGGGSNGGGVAGGSFEAMIGDEASTYTTYNVPMNYYYCYSLSTQLYLGTELVAAGVTTSPMSSISWFSETTTNHAIQNISIWMANVSDTEANSTSPLGSGMTLVYQGNFQESSGWNEFVFNAGSFAWDGQSNVLVMTQMNNGDWASGLYWRYHIAGFDASSYARSDYDMYDAANTAYSMTATTSRANTLFKSNGSTDVTITLSPGWTWISYLGTEPQDFATALGSFIPEVGDVIKSKWGTATYRSSGRWVGTISRFDPGYGYHYKSQRTVPVTVTLNAQPPLQVAVTTAIPTSITAYGMTCGGTVTDQGDNQIIVRGVCWSNAMSPTIAEPHTTDGYGTGSFSSLVEGLEMNSTYYVRAYVVTANGTAYGDQKMFSTKNGVPTLTTSAASEIGTTWATCGGGISDDGGMEITERGICWSTSSNPTIAGNHGSNGAGLGNFSVNMNGLEPNTTYYVRAYATNGHTTAYGNEVSFHTEVAQTWPNGKLPGQFSVSETHKVQFSQGNLQYQGATGTWRFASSQWEYLGTTTGQNSNAQDVDRDLFGWGTSGWDNGNVYYQPYDCNYLTDWNASDFGYGYGPTDGTNYNYGLTGNYANADWGVYNAILNGGNASQQWRTLTNSEWNYVLNTRTTTSGIRYAKAQVYGMNGLLLLPDDWSSSVYELSYTNRSDAPFTTNVIADADWATMENNGVVFLPVAGYRSGTSLSSGIGYYWTANNSGSSSAYYRSFSGLSVSSSTYSKNRGHSVRLVSVTLPEVSTGSVSYISGNSALVEGHLIAAGNVDISACGICCSTTPNPTPNDIVALAQITTEGEFAITVNGLSPNTTYYARAFVTSAGTVYGNEITFTTISAPTWEGVLPGAFSVSADRQVNFSQGNLQYIGSATTPYWKFADHQWDILGTTTGQNSDGENVDRDLFGWGTSSFNHGAVCYQPWSTSQTNSDYYAYGSYSYNLFAQTGQADWGYNPISNGGNQPNRWRSLTTAEWVYVFNTRETTSGIRYAKAKVNDVNGVILLPDNWNSSYYTLSDTNSSGASFSSNVITASQWNTLELHGAVFLPAAGGRSGTSVGGVGSYGYYWSASYYYSYYAYSVYFDDSYLYTSSYDYRYYGFSVRLARVAEN